MPDSQKKKDSKNNQAPARGASARESRGREKHDAPQFVPAEAGRGEVMENQQVSYSPFPGPKEQGVPLRVTMDRAAYAELIFHAKGSLESEIGGVLAGVIGKDEDGFYVRVRAAIEGLDMRQGSAHVTFTQQTWIGIHDKLEKEYPNLQIVGWYHSHPGFGVEFSEMDLFIQSNFFPSPVQIALVVDPLGGEEAICINSPEGIKYLDRFWVEGRERRCQTPRSPGKKGPPAAAAGGSSASSEENLARIEVRLSQLIQTLDDDRARHGRFLVGIGIFVCLCVVGLIVNSIYHGLTSRMEPPSLNSYAQVPVRMGDKVIMLGVGVVDWKVPDELNDTYLRMEQIKKEQAEKLAEEAETAKKQEESPGQQAAGKDKTEKGP
jgi:proteasome lid subunit RPN8/RPN11